MSPQEPKAAALAEHGPALEAAGATDVVTAYQPAGVLARCVVADRIVQTCGDTPGHALTLLLAKIAGDR